MPMLWREPQAGVTSLGYRTASLEHRRSPHSGPLSQGRTVVQERGDDSKRGRRAAGARWARDRCWCAKLKVELGPVSQLQRRLWQPLKRSSLHLLQPLRIGTTRGRQCSRLTFLTPCGTHLRQAASCARSAVMLRRATAAPAAACARAACRALKLTRRLQVRSAAAVAGPTAPWQRL